MVSSTYTPLMQALWMLVAALLFSLMGACIKFASAYYSPAEVVFYRSLVGVIIAGLYAHVGAISLRTPYWLTHIRRGVSGVVAMMLWFAAIATLPLATAMTFNYTAPIWIALILWLTAPHLRKSPATNKLLLAIFISFVGVVCLLQPTVAAESFKEALLGLLSGLVSAFAYLSVRKLGQLGEPEVRTVFYFSFIGMLVGGVWMLLQGMHTLTAHGLLLLLGVGTFATMAQLAMTRAYRLGNTLLATNLYYAGIIFSTVLGIWVWGDHPNLWSWIGMTLIILSGTASAVVRARMDSTQHKTLA